MTRKAILQTMPLKTHVDMVTLTLDNLELKLCALSESQNEMSTDEVELLQRLADRLMQQRVRVEFALKPHSSLRGMQ